jgi:hypothetical protein
MPKRSWPPAPPLETFSPALPIDEDFGEIRARAASASRKARISGTVR